MANMAPPEIAHYQSEGWVVPQFALAPRAWPQLRDALDQLLRDNPGVRPEKLVSAHIEGDNGEGVRGSRHFLELAQDPQIVELVSGVIGDDVILWGCHVFCKPAHEGYETPWHQDGHYWPIRPLANCTVWVALEPSTVRQRLPARDPALASQPRAARAPARRPHRPDAQSAHGRRHVRRGAGGGHRAAAGPDVAARRVHDPRRAAQHLARNAAPAWRCATCRRPRCSSATCGRRTASRAWRSTSPSGRCGC